MGCWDIFCLLCGNPPHRCFSNILENFEESIEYYEKNANKKKKWFINYFSPIYKQYKANPDKFIKSIKLMKKRTGWMHKCTFLAADGSVNHGCSETSCNIGFQDNKFNRFVALQYFDDISAKYGVFVHTDCWKFIKKEHGISLQYKHLPIKKISEVERKVLPDIDYGLMEKYWVQDFDFIKMISDGNEDLAISPLKSELTGKYINKIFSKLKIRDDKKRSGPVVSASFYKEPIYRIGESGNIWCIKGNKWIEVKQTVKFSIGIKNIGLIKNISLSQDINSQPIFVLKITKNTIDLIASEDIKNKIKN